MIDIRNAVIFWLPPVIWMIFISPVNALLTSQSSSSLIIPLIAWLLPCASQNALATLHILLRKAGHFLEYAFLAFLLFRAFRQGSKRFRHSWFLYAGLISLGYSAVDEYLQTFIPARTGSFYDWIIDASGIACSLGILMIRGKHNRSGI
jgi:VanZ family protein